MALKKTGLKSNKVRMKVTDINAVAGAITLEGSFDEVNYILLIDYDNDIKEFQPAKALDVGDTFDLAIASILEVKPKPKAKAASNTNVAAGSALTKGKKVALPKGAQCPGSMQNIKNYRGGYGKKYPCEVCGKWYVPNANGQMRRHSV